MRLGDNVHGDLDVEGVFHLHDEIENADGVDVQFLRNVGGRRESDALGIVGCQQAADFVDDEWVKEMNGKNFNGKQLLDTAKSLTTKYTK